VCAQRARPPSNMSLLGSKYEIYQLKEPVEDDMVVRLAFDVAFICVFFGEFLSFFNVGF